MHDAIFQPVETVPYGEELVQIHEAILRAIPHYPQNCCGLPTIVIRELLGLPGVGARCNLLRYSEDGNQGHKHACNVDDARGVYVDLSLYQFDETMVDWDPDAVIPPDPAWKPFTVNVPRIAIYPVDSGIVVPDHEFQRELDQMGLMDGYEVLGQFQAGSTCARIADGWLEVRRITKIFDQLRSW